MMFDIVVIGAGPAGCMAAISAASSGCSVAVLERNGKIGRKLIITGKGRCNLTNNTGNEDIICHVVRNPRFLYSCVNAFSPADVMSFFEGKGVRLKTERGKRVFPASDRSEDIVDALYEEIKKKTELFLNFRATSVTVDENGVFCIESATGKPIKASSVIIATGGITYPSTGSTGDGYAFAESFGHNIVCPSPSLVPLNCADEDIIRLQGLTLKNVSLSLFEGERSGAVYGDIGELLFTHFGISGPLALSASCHMTVRSADYFAVVDLKPGLAAEELDCRVLRDFAGAKNKNFSNALFALLPVKMIPVVIDRSGIPPETKVNSISRAQRMRLVDTIKNFRLSGLSLRGPEEAVVTRGGINVREIDPGTMESKLMPGLYFAGEVIDCDAYTGGYNLQIAFSTGFMAGLHAAKNKRIK